MTRHPEGYDNWRAVEMAIKSAAIRAHEADPRLLVSDLIRQAYYDRFLTRVFWEGEASQWVLKGGGGMLARVPNARRTLDADLYHEGYTADQEVADLRRVADRDLGDFFRIVYTSHRVILAQDIQPYTEGYRVIFEARLGPKPGDTIKVDLSTHVGATDAVTVAEPANRLPVAKLVTAPYRLYPVVN
ncbi:MAG: nucleotidyl transferase AbiEii/AbiGii toxin family protein, partial [Bifidobacteriaceae bacterium]|nr:nucleotidyl transferase AbiEii/AbiGii toxin family protein [Bifidobacteriaceae bacterium]